MRYLKKFEAWGGQSLPVTNVESLMTYCSCVDCNALYKVFNKSQYECAYCGSSNLKVLDIDAYYNNLISRLDDEEEIQDMLKVKKEEEEGFIDLIEIGQELNRNQSLRNSDKTKWN